MTYHGEGDSPLQQDGQPEKPIQERSPTLRADISLLVPRADRRATVERLIPDRISVRSFTDPDTFVRELNGNVAVAILSLTVSEECLRAVVRRLVAESEHAQIALLADESIDFLDCEIPHDELFVPPLASEEFIPLIKRVYIRAYYSVTLERVYQLGLSTQYHEMQVQAGESDDDGRLERLEESTKLTKAYLAEFRRYLQPEDFEALSNRGETLHSIASFEEAGSDPSVHGLPDSCPDCGLDWTRNHGPRFGNGYESIGANAWRCTRCSHVIANPGPENHRVT